MQIGTLSDLQIKILQELAQIEPPWTLTGGAALAGFYLKHRVTKDLDLFWHGKELLGVLPILVTSQLKQHGWEVETIQTSPAFCRLRVADSHEVVMVDLVAEPVGFVEEPKTVSVGHIQIHIDGSYEILVNKFCTLLSRSELRDLQDVHALLKQENAIPLQQILRDAARKDAGFSPLTFAWILQNYPIDKVARSLSWPEKQIEELCQFREELLHQLLKLSQPE